LQKSKKRRKDLKKKAKAVKIEHTKKAKAADEIVEDKKCQLLKTNFLRIL
jgi:hypothetical protein